MSWLSARDAHSRIREAPEQALVHAAESELLLQDMPWSQQELCVQDQPQLLVPSAASAEHFVHTAELRPLCTMLLVPAHLMHYTHAAEPRLLDMMLLRYGILCNVQKPQLLRDGHSVRKPGRLCRCRVRAAGELLRPAVCVTARCVVPQVRAQPVRLPLPRRHVQHEPPEPLGSPVCPAWVTILRILLFTSVMNIVQLSGTSLLTRVSVLLMCLTW